MGMYGVSNEASAVPQQPMEEPGPRRPPIISKAGVGRMLLGATLAEDDDLPQTVHAQETPQPRRWQEPLTLPAQDPPCAGVSEAIQKPPQQRSFKSSGDFYGARDEASYRQSLCNSEVESVVKALSEHASQQDKAFKAEDNGRPLQEQTSQTSQRGKMLQHGDFAAWKALESKDDGKPLPQGDVDQVEEKLDEKPAEGNNAGGVAAYVGAVALMLSPLLIIA